MLRMVLLKHIEGGGGHEGGRWHYDWMVERCEGADPEERALVTFRVGVHPGEAMEAGGRFRATRIGDHRRVYLTKTGELGGGRGSVERVAAGWVRELVEQGGRVEIEGAFDGSGRVLRWVGEACSEDEWEFVARSLAS